MENASKHCTDGFDSTYNPLPFDRVSFAFYATRSCIRSTFCNRLDSNIITLLGLTTGSCLKRSATCATKCFICIAKPPWIPLRQYDVRDLREIATVIHRTCVREYCVRSLAFTLSLTCLVNITRYYRLTRSLQIGLRNGRNLVPL